MKKIELIINQTKFYGSKQELNHVFWLALFVDITTCLYFINPKLKVKK